MVKREKKKEVRRLESLERQRVSPRSREEAMLC